MPNISFNPDWPQAASLLIQALELMAPVTILVKEPSPVVSLAAFASQLEKTLGLSSLQERESSNYEQGHYFSANFGGSKITLFYLDTVGLEQYLFGVEVETTEANLGVQTAQAIAKAGFPCFVPEGAWYKKSWGGHGTAYEF